MTTALSVPNARNVAQARKYLRINEPGIYARSLAGIHRSVSKGQQAAIEAAIREDDMAGVFYRHPTNGCLMARKVEMAS